MFTGYMVPHSAVRRAWEQQVAALAVPATWIHAGTPRAFGVGYGVPRDTDSQVANALGVGVRMVTIRAIDTAGAVPEALDRIDVAGEQLTINSVTPVLMGGVAIGWRCPCAGGRPGP